eukprot:2090979-Karenia_brevis.AAC.1
MRPSDVIQDLISCLSGKLAVCRRHSPCCTKQTSIDMHAQGLDRCRFANRIGNASREDENPM